jgi:hypothetical protein
MSFIDIIKEMGDWLGIPKRADEAANEEVRRGAETLRRANEIIRHLAQQNSDLIDDEAAPIT